MAPTGEPDTPSTTVPIAVARGALAGAVYLAGLLTLVAGVGALFAARRRIP
ncbi:MAG: hypothetical protein HOY78_31030 [Saccharothrix sp.]|nr:hypothetical protein [Saccharothrix sp.]